MYQSHSPPQNKIKNIREGHSQRSHLFQQNKSEVSQVTSFQQISQKNQEDVQYEEPISNSYSRKNSQKSSSKFEIQSQRQKTKNQQQQQQNQSISFDNLDQSQQNLVSYPKQFQNDSNKQQNFQDDHRLHLQLQQCQDDSQSKQPSNARQSVESIDEQGTQDIINQHRLSNNFLLNNQQYTNSAIQQQNNNNTSYYKKDQSPRKNKAFSANYKPGIHNFQQRLMEQQNQRMKKDKSQELDDIQLEMLNNQKKTGNLSPIWQKKGFMIIKSIKKFFQKLFPIIPSRKFKMLNRNHFQVLNDAACDYEYYRYLKKFHTDIPNCFDKFIYKSIGGMRRRCRVIAKPIERIIEKCDILILPDSFMKLLWDSFILVLLIVNIFYIPIKIAWQVNNSDDNSTQSIQYWIIYMVDIIPQWGFLFDIIMNFNTAFYQTGKLIKDRTLIAKRYLKGKFIWDFIVVTPFFINQYLIQYAYIDIILLLRQKKIKNIIKTYEELINLRNKNKGIYDLMKLILFILFVAHFTGCCMYFIGIQQIEAGENESWLQINSTVIYGQSWELQYTACLYYSVITMITVGYGDFTPQTTLERQFAIIITLISCGVFAYSVNNIGTIIGQMTKRESEFSSDMSLLITYMRKRGMSKELQFRVKNYFEYLYEENIQENEDAEGILNKLCDSLKQEVFYNIYYKELKIRKIFSLNFSSQFLQVLSTKMDERWLGPEELIHEKDNYLGEINIVMKGNVEFFVQSINGHIKTTKTIKVIKENDIFGEDTFFTDTKTISGAKTNNVVLLMRIKKSDFLDIIQNFPQDYQKYCMIKHNIIHDNDLTHVLNSRCLICNSYSHRFNVCPSVNYVPNKGRIMNIYKKSDQPQQRYYITTRGESKINTRSMFYYVKQNAFYYLVDVCEPEEFAQLMQNFDKLEGVAQTFLQEREDIERINGTPQANQNLNQLAVKKRSQSLKSNFSREQSQFTKNYQNQYNTQQYLHEQQNSTIQYGTSNQSISNIDDYNSNFINQQQEPKSPTQFTTRSKNISLYSQHKGYQNNDNQSELMTRKRTSSLTSMNRKIKQKHQQNNLACKTPNIKASSYFIQDDQNSQSQIPFKSFEMVQEIDQLKSEIESESREIKIIKEMDNEETPKFPLKNKLLHKCKTGGLDKQVSALKQYSSYTNNNIIYEEDYPNENRRSNIYKRMNSNYSQSSKLTTLVGKQQEQIKQILKQIFPDSQLWKQIEENEQSIQDYDNENDLEGMNYLGFTSMNAVWEKVKNFEKMQIYTTFLPNNNVDTVLIKLKKIIEKRTPNFHQKNTLKYKQKFSRLQSKHLSTKTKHQENSPDNNLDISSHYNQPNFQSMHYKKDYIEEKDTQTQGNQRKRHVQF